MRLTPDKGQSVFLNNRSIPLQTKLLSWLEVDPKDRLNVGEYNMISDTQLIHYKKNITFTIKKYYLNISIIYISSRFQLSIGTN
jgi:hypothetical protein